MSFLSKLMFWKKEGAPPLEAPPELPPLPDLGKPADLGPPPSEMPPSLGLPSEKPSAEFTPPASPAHVPESLPGLEEPSPSGFAQSRFAPPSAPASADKLEIISAKLDTLKAQLDSVLQRLERLEQFSKEEHLYRQRWR
ncbi:hypothetical protein DRJ22_02735 [Candidatus Woesearchaeota archaeon]|nr:MAG: hypothetical protein B6U93_01550 [Candidatus Woesearchaeota archaeon ex4484_78]RLE46115.1 MAG: hypothetical protein DRJ22_02735 [Candidatus Woesearchaeota archaeon]